MTRTRPALIACALFALVQAQPTLAQTLRGRVLDQGDERPLEQMAVTLLDRDAEALRVVFSDSLGRYELRMPAPGEYYVSAEGLGYETTRSPLLAVVDPDGVFSIDLSVRPSPLGIPGFVVTAERFEEINRRLRQLIGRSPSSLRMPPIMRPEIEDHLARSHSIEDLVRWSSVPSLQVRTTSRGPCFLIRPGSTVRVPESCVGVYLNGVPLVLEAVPALPLDIVETAVIVMPDESILYPTGAVLLYSAGWIG